ncbi:hypothetical protein Tco_1445749, partial [Tanacetum coccineum]
MGGLGVGSLLAKNISLLGKWKWRFLIEKEALWRTVIKEFYEECGGFGSLAGSRGPNGIWCDIIKVVEDIEKIDPSFKRSSHIKVSNGANVSFWKDTWRENETRGKRPPRGMAIDDVMDLVSTIGNLSLSSASIDRWSWSKDASGSGGGGGAASVPLTSSSITTQSPNPADHRAAARAFQFHPARPAI